MSDRSGVPEGWELAQLGELANIRRGASPRPIQDPKWFSEHGPGWVRIGDVTKSRRFLRKTEQCLSPAGVACSVHVKPGDVIMSICATIGEPLIVDTEACIHDGFVAFTEFEDALDRMFLTHELRFLQAAFRAMGQTGTQANLNTGLVSSMTFPLPPLAEQRKIAEILGSVDDNIEKTQALIAKLQDLKKATMQELLTKGIGHTKFKDSPVGRIPEEWAISKVADEFVITTGLSMGPHRRPNKCKRRYLRVANVMREALVLDDVAEMEATDDVMKERTLAEGDLLVVEGHANPLEIGRCAMANKATIGMTFQNHLFRLRPIRLQARFALAWLNGEYVRRYWQISSGTSSGLNTINASMLRAVEVAIPPAAEQLSIAAVLDALDGNLLLQVSHFERLKILKNALMQDLLTGKVRVKA